MENDTVKHFKPLVDLETGLHWEKKRKCWYITDHDKFFFLIATLPDTTGSQGDG